VKNAKRGKVKVHDNFEYASFEASADEPGANISEVSPS
jgi:hypothetical protein